MPVKKVNITAGQILQKRSTDDTNLYRQLTQEMLPSITYFAFHLTMNTSVSEEIASDAFIKLWNNPEKIQHVVDIKAYLYKITRNACIDHLRREKVKTKRDADLLHGNSAIELPVLDLIIKTEVISELHAAFSRLPEQYQRVLELQYFDGQTIKEVSKTMNLSVNTVKTYRLRGLTKLRRWLTIIFIVSLVKIFLFNH